MKGTKPRKIVKVVICLILSIIIFVGIEIYIDEIKEKEIYEVENKLNDNKIQNDIDERNTIIAKKVKEYPKVEVIDSYKGYKVSAKLEIPKINLETYILQKYSIQSLNVSVTKFWGADANEDGNFCVAGHNFPQKNMFYKLKKLEIGDCIFISDNKIGRVEYEIYDVYKVEPKDVDCLSQETDGKKEVTLITCTNDSKKRIIVKAREKEI